jgi:hypothetical protein
MARYIDADALLGNLKRQYGEELGWWCTVNMSDVGMMIEDAPTANVAPMEEVERLQTICDSYIVQYGTVAHKEVLLKKERADTVKKMQEKLIATFCPDANYCGYDIHAAINEKAKEILEGNNEVQ